MRVIVIGAGEVGWSTAQALQTDHDVVLIEKEPERFETLQELDVLALCGNGASLKTLKEAGAERAEMAIACTDIDEVNIVACAAAKQLGTKLTIARVQDAEYLQTWKRGYLGVDEMVCSELITAQALARLMGLREIRASEEFADGKILMTETIIEENAPIIGLKLKDAAIPPQCNVASIVRDGRVTIPRGDDVILAHDRLVLIGTPSAVGEFNRRLSLHPTVKDILIIGGGRIGFRLAQLLQPQGLHPKIVEIEEERSRWLAENLPQSIVFHGDGTDIDLLEQEGLGKSEIAVSVIGIDEKNLLCGLLLKRLGVAKVIARVEDPDFVAIFERVGIDIAINPRRLVAEEIISFTRDRIEKTLFLEENRAEVLEIEVSPQSPLLGVKLAQAQLPAGLLVGAIVRAERVIIPRGSDALRPRDRVILFSTPEAAREIERLL
ncbi:Trk system potassium transporter TrkA [Candidatus Acetothermia bacterium]|jgi:trk system potassium uptake protein TrkA|nr:Trk system potassium transporter TrkA [Candidatus Acetothermia bacterium]MCI2431657.1 Trk system potassium transporter TrkA [Candidatus Acetothermia bacterium]MCI2436373.1 Trk system potassium transporter TrkA [Candidatus Acetothermia bacterium]